MEQRERIKRIVREELPGATIVFHEEAVKGKSAEAFRAARVAKLFGAEYSSDETISFTIEDSSGRMIPKMIIAGPDDLSDERLRKALRMMT